MIDVRGCSSLADITQKIAQTLDNKSSCYVKAKGSELYFTTAAVGSNIQPPNYPLSNLTVPGKSIPAKIETAHDETKTIQEKKTLKDVPGTGKIGSANLTDGVDGAGEPGNPDYHSPLTAKYTINLSGAIGKGFTINSNIYCKLVPGNNISYDNATNSYQIGIDSNISDYTADPVSLSMKNGQLTVTTISPGAAGNSISIQDGIPAHKIYVPKQITVARAGKKNSRYPIEPLNSSNQLNPIAGIDGKYATYKMI